MITVEQVKVMISKMAEHVAGLQKKAQDDERYYTGSLDTLIVLSQEIDKIEKGNQKNDSKVNSIPGPGEEEKVRAIRASSRAGKTKASQKGNRNR